MHSAWFSTTVLIFLTTSFINAYGGGDLASPAEALQPAQKRVSARLVTGQTPLIAGTIAEIGIHLTIQSGWHIYWDGQNDTGLPVTYTARFPEGFEPLPILWPAPDRHAGEGEILDHIYENQVTLIVPVRIPASAAGSTATLAMDLSWLVCKNVCLPEEAAVELKLPVAAAGASQAPTAEAALIAKTHARLPRPMPTDPSVASVRWDGGTLTLTGRAGQRIEFYPGAGSAPVKDLIKSGAGRDGRLTLRFESPPPRIVGVLAVWPGGDAAPEFYQVDTSGPAGAGPADRK